MSSRATRASNARKTPAQTGQPGPDPTLAELRTEIELLRTENARLAARNAELELRCVDPAELDLQNRGTGACPRCGTKAAAALARAGDPGEDQIFPNELFVMISEYFEPGTRNLLNLARTCRELYALLLPRLYHTFDVPKIASIWKDAMRVQGYYDEDEFPTIPSGLDHVKVLDLSCSPFDQIYSQSSLIFACANVVELRLNCSKQSFFMGLFIHPLLPRLEKLTLYIKVTDHFDEYEPGTVFGGLATVKELELHHSFSPRLVLLIMASCPRLETVHCSFLFPVNEDPHDSNVLNLAPDFVAKIKTWRLRSFSQLGRLQLKYPCFRPESVICDNEWISEDEFRVLGTMDSLRRLELGKISTLALLEGLPPNLAYLKFENLDLEIAGEADRSRLREILKTCKGVEWVINHDEEEYEVVDMDAERIVDYIKELEIWKEVPGFHHRPWEEMAERIKELGL